MTRLYKYVGEYSYSKECYYFLISTKYAVLWIDDKARTVPLHYFLDLFYIGTLCISDVILRLNEATEFLNDLPCFGFLHCEGALKKRDCQKRLDYLEAKFKTIQLFYKQRYHVRKSAAIFIQYLWKRCYFNPLYKMCQKRIQNWT